MVEIDSDGSQILESPESMEKREKLKRARELDDRIAHARHRKEVEAAIKARRETAHQMKMVQNEKNRKQHVSVYQDPTGLTTWKAEVLEGKTKARNLPVIAYPETV